jgi:hypothetical protein
MTEPIDESDRQVGLVGEQSSTTTNDICVTELRRRLAIIHDLSKHIWQDNSRRNFRLLKQIHEMSDV